LALASAPLIDAIPPYEYAFSFPSGHTLNSTVIAGMVAYLVARRLTSRVGRALCVIAAAIWAIAMGLSRVFLGHHWLTDVIFAWLIGLAWLALLITAHRIFLLVRRSRQAGAVTTGPEHDERLQRPRAKPRSAQPRGTCRSLVLTGSRGSSQVIDNCIFCRRQCAVRSDGMISNVSLSPCWRV
jgi:membrane-associated phospholipid phosphatase